jgi:hypothetical protein
VLMEIHPSESEGGVLILPGAARVVERHAAAQN